MRNRQFVWLILSLFLAGAGPATPPATSPAELTRESLRLLPAAAPNGISAGLRSDLQDSHWELLGNRNIRGEGADILLRFAEIDPAGNLKLQETTVRYYRPPAAPRWFTQTYSARIDGPLLSFNDHLETFVLLRGAELVSGAIVPLGHGKWYFASLEHPSSGRVHERYWEDLFDFHDDPMKNARGAVKLQQRLDNVVTNVDATFIAADDRLGRYVNIQRQGTSIERITLADDAKYGYINPPAGRPQVFYPGK